MYETDDGVYLIRADGSDKRKLLSAEEWSVSRDGKRLAYFEPPGSIFGDAKIFAFSIGEERPSLLVEGEYSFEGWVGSGKFLWVRPVAFEEELIRYEEGEVKDSITVPGWTMITEHDELVSFDCPDPGGECGLQVKDLNSGSETTLPGHPPPDQPCSSTGTCWSQDLRAASYLDTRDYAYNLHVLSADSGVSASLASGVEAANISPDGHRVAFVKSVGDPLFPSYEVFAVNSSGGAPVELTADQFSSSGRRPVWSYNSQRVYFPADWMDYSIKSDGTDGHGLDVGEAAFCRPAAAGLQGLWRQSPLLDSVAIVGLDAEDHPGVWALAKNAPSLQEITEQKLPECVVSADSRYAVEWSGGDLRVYDLMSGGNRRIVDSGILSAAWAGTCATVACPADEDVPKATPTPGPTPYPGKLARGVEPIIPMFAISKGELRLYRNPGSAAVDSITGDYAVGVIGRALVNGETWYFATRDLSLSSRDSLFFIHSADVELMAPTIRNPAAVQAKAVITVAEGDTLESIAARFSVTVEAIMAANPGILFEGLSPGDRILIPKLSGGL